MTPAAVRQISLIPNGVRMFTSLPSDLAAFIPSALHDRALDVINESVSTALDAERESIRDAERRRLKAAILASLSLDTGACENHTPPASIMPAHRSKGILDARSVVMFRERSPGAYEKIVAYLQSIPPRSPVNYALMREFSGYKGRDMRLPAVLRELGCYERSGGCWLSPLAEAVAK